MEAAPEESRAVIIVEPCRDLEIEHENKHPVPGMARKHSKYYKDDSTARMRCFPQRGNLTGRVDVFASRNMESALLSAIDGEKDKPFIALPTSVGYGANFGGLSALPGILNSCASGVALVDIDNGFGAACTAAMINRTNTNDKWTYQDH